MSETKFDIEAWENRILQWAHEAAPAVPERCVYAVASEDELMKGIPVPEQIAVMYGGIIGVEASDNGMLRQGDHQFIIMVAAKNLRSPKIGGAPHQSAYGLVSLVTGYIDGKVASGGRAMIAGVQYLRMDQKGLWAYAITVGIKSSFTWK